MAKVLILGSMGESLINFRGPLIEAMLSKGHKVVVCAPFAPQKVRRALQEMGAEYQSVFIDRAGLNVIKDLQTIYELNIVFRQAKPDILLNYTIKPIIYGSLLSSILGIPKVFSMVEGLGYAFSGFDHKSKIIGAIVRTLYRLSFAKNHRVFLMNKGDLSYFKKAGIIRKREQAVLLNGIGVDLKHYKPAPYPTTVSFLYMSRFLKDKGIREFVEAARQVKKKHPHIVFKMAGWIDENPLSITNEELRSWIREGVVEYLGKLSDVRPAIANCSVFVLPSYYKEGVPRTILEAMSMARPIITTDNPGCRQTVENDVNGFIVPIKNVEAIVQAMEKFIDSPDIIPIMGMKSRQMAEKKYDVNKINSVILKTMGL